MFSHNFSHSETIPTWQNLYMHVYELHMIQKAKKKVLTVSNRWPECQATWKQIGNNRRQINQDFLKYMSTYKSGKK